MPQDPHKAVDARQARTGNNTVTYDQIVKRVKSVSSVNADDELVYNELYGTSPDSNVLKQIRDCSVPRCDGFYSSLNHGLRNAKKDADQLDNTLPAIVSVTNNESDTVDDYGSEYSFVYTTSVLPRPSHLSALHQEIFPSTTSQTAPNDGITTDTADCVGKDTQNIPMTHNHAYNVGSARNSHEDLKQQLSIYASPMEYALPIGIHCRGEEREGQNELSGISYNCTLPPVKSQIYNEQSYLNIAVTDDD